MTKIVYNTCYGGFGLSDKAIKRYWELKGKPVPDDFTQWDFEDNRADPILAQVVEELGEDADGHFAELAIHELEPGTKYRIHEYDGLETVMSIDDYKWSVA